jgi:serine protease Do
MILCTTAFPALARADSKTIVVNLWIGNSVMSVNGLRQPIDSQGTKPVILESRTLVPIRAIIEAFGGDVGWDAIAKKVTIVFNNNTLELWIGQSIASLNGYTMPIDSTNSKVVPMIISGRTMVPLRFVAESFGIDVQYDDKTKMITLTYVAETKLIVQLPVAPMLASPTNNSTLNNSNITFTWTVVSGVDYYKLQIIKDGLTVNSFESITTTSYTLTGITLADGTYSWQVAAHNSAGWSSWSSSFVFVIQTQLSITDIAKFVDRVVYIEVNGYDENGPFNASGSGFLISSDGKILTNYHVIDHALSGTVTLNDKTKFDIVSTLGYSKTDDKDLAVIKINASNLPVCRIGDSNNVQVGESVVAIGSPLGLKETQNTVSNGIISKIWDNGFIQTTAPISPGSSGGPLFNMKGEVVGVTEAGYPEGENLNLAVPINWLKTIDTSLNMTLEQVYLKENGFIPTIPGTPQLISPANNSILTTTTPTLTWTAVSGADYYGVWIGEGTIPDDKYKVWYKNVTSNSVTIPSSILNDGKAYTWSVCAHNSFGFGDWSEDSHFTVSVPQLTPPTLISPEDKKGLFPEDLSFQWSPVPGAISYTLEIYGKWVNLAYFDELYTKKINQNSFKIPEADAATYLKTEYEYLYKYRVGAVNDNGIVWSEERYFTIIQRDYPYLMYPDNCTTYYAKYSSVIHFYWLSSSFATKYILYIYEGTNINNSSPILKQTVYSSSFDLPIGSLQLNKTYSWYVEAYYGEYIIGISKIRMFNIVP